MRPVHGMKRSILLKVKNIFTALSRPVFDQTAAPKPGC
jgi:hypothetical protein